MRSNAQRKKGPRHQRAVVIFLLLLVAAGLMMMWTWTADTFFVLLSGVPILCVVMVCLYGNHQGTFEVIGGPLDGAHVPSALAGPDTEDLVLRTQDGERAHYRVMDHQSLLYRGPVGGRE